MNTVLVFIPFLTLCAYMAWCVQRERGKVRLSELELAMRRLTAGFKAMEAAMGQALLPAVKRATTAMQEWNHAWSKSL